MIRNLPPVKILIVDDHPVVREGMSMLLSTQPDLTVCGEAETEDEGVKLVKRTNPDVVIVDIGLTSGHGIELIKRIKEGHPKVKMLVVSGFQESLYAERSIRAGAQGYLNKQESTEKLIDAIRCVLQGDRYLSDAVKQRIVSQALGNSKAAETPIEQLTDRELEVFRMIGQGLTSGTIASRIHVSTHTIDTHRENIKRKLGAKNAAELTREAVRWVLENG